MVPFWINLTFFCIFFVRRMRAFDLDRTSMVGRKAGISAVTGCDPEGRSRADFRWNALRPTLRASFTRILVGFAIGTMIGIPLGLLMGASRFVRSFMDPYVEFFRFIPPIAFVTLAVIWFGLGETSKIVLIVYTTLFMVAINTMIGVIGIEPDKRFAALCLGASQRQVVLSRCHPRRYSEHRHWYENRNG